MHRLQASQHRSWIRRRVPPLTPLRIDRYRFASQDTIGELQGRILSFDTSSRVKVSNWKHDRTGDAASFHVSHVGGDQRRWPQLDALVTVRSTINGTLVVVAVRMKSAHYMFDATMTVLVALTLYGIGQGIAAAVAVFCLALLFMHVRFFITRQWPDDLAALIARCFSLSPLNIDEARET